jgi:hypothetical protein
VKAPEALRAAVSAPAAAGVSALTAGRNMSSSLGQGCGFARMVLGELDGDSTLDGEKASFYGSFSSVERRSSA